MARAKNTKADLSGYVNQPHLRQHWHPNEAGFAPDQVDESLKMAERDYALAMNIIDAMAGMDTPLRYLLSRASMEACIATREYLECDLSTSAGVDRARGLQSRAIRYRELVEWLIEAINKGTDAASLIEDAEELGDVVSQDVEQPTGPGDDIDGITAVQDGRTAEG